MNDLKETCEHCGSNRIYHGPPDCPTCGAPNCCQTCCKIDSLLAENAKKDERIRELEAEARQFPWEKAGKHDWLAAENAKLRGLIEAAPHETSCSFTKWIPSSKCFCWKSRALPPAK